MLRRLWITNYSNIESLSKEYKKSDHYLQLQSGVFSSCLEKGFGFCVADYELWHWLWSDTVSATVANSSSGEVYKNSLSPSFPTMFMASEDLQESSTSLPINNINKISPCKLVHWLSLYQSFLEMLSTRDLLAFLSKLKNPSKVSC